MKTIRRVFVVIALLAINGAISASAQDFIINGSHYTPALDLFAARLYNEDDVKLSDNEIEGLEQYGFDYKKWSDIKRNWMVSNYTIASGTLVLASGSYIRYHLEKPYLGLGLQLAGWGIIFSSQYFQYKIGKKLSNWVDSYNANTALGFTPNGFGLTYKF